MGKTRDLFKNIRDTKGTFHARMGSIQDRNGTDLTEAEDIKKRWHEYTEELYKKDLHDPDNHDGVITSQSQTCHASLSFTMSQCAALSCSVMSDSLQPHGLQPTRLLCPWDSPGKNTDVGSLSLLQGIFLTQESNRGLLHCRQIFYQLSYEGSPSEVDEPRACYTE